MYAGLLTFFGLYLLISSLIKNTIMAILLSLLLIMSLYHNMNKLRNSTAGITLLVGYMGPS